MPNHVINRLEIVGHENHIEDVMRSLRSKSDPDVCFDFNSFLPMPEVLREITSPAKIVSKAQFKIDMKEYNAKVANPSDQDKFLGITHSITQEMSDSYMARFGADDWYNWALMHWGTKWGAYDTRLVSREPDTENPQYIRVKIEFQTAWSSAGEAIGKLSGQFPKFVFFLTYADEDCGFNVGKLKFKQGNIIDSHVPDGGSNEAMELYFECHGKDEHWEMVDGEWKYEYE